MVEYIYKTIHQNKLDNVKWYMENRNGMDSPQERLQICKRQEILPIHGCLKRQIAPQNRKRGK